MTVLEHLDELRGRIFICLAAYFIGAIVAYIFYRPILDFLKAPLDTAGQVGGVKVDDLYVGGIATGFVLRLKVSAFAGVFLGLPVILFQFWRFITPGLEPREKRYAIPFVLASLALFAMGTTVSWLLLPVGIRWLLGFVPPAQPLIQLTEYLSFVFLMSLGFGLSFEFPVVLVFLGALGVVSWQTLASKRRLAIVVVFVVAAIATPSGDPLTQAAMALPLYILYELSILVIRFAFKKGNDGDQG